LLKAKHTGKCGDSKCAKVIKPGDEAMYYPASRTIVCRACATPTLEALADEQMMGGY
jgi:recombinational DNA repair protein (RecF pathway)